MRELQRTNLASRAYEEIRKGLMAGEFEPGEALKLGVLSDRLGTSQTPIREALMQLGAERALVVEPGRSPRVPHLSRDRFIELRDIRVALETLAARNAAECTTPALERELRSVHERMMRAKIGARFKDTLVLNRRFHFMLYRTADLATLIAMIESLWMQTGPYLNFLYPGPPIPTDASHPHERILHALEVRDGAAVALAVEEDIVQGGGPILSHLDEKR